MKKYCFVAFNLLASCTVIPTSSHFADGQLTLNLDKQTVIERYGNPFSMDISIDTDSVLKEHLYYRYLTGSPPPLGSSTSAVSEQPRQASP